MQRPNDAIFVTGADATYARTLHQLLRAVARKGWNRDMTWVAYDLGMRAEQRVMLENRFDWVTFRTLDLAALPGHYVPAEGSYAWKPLIFWDVVEAADGPVIWMDSANLPHGAPDGMLAHIRAHGLYLLRGQAPLQERCDPKVLEALDVPRWTWGMRECVSGLIGVDAGNPEMREIMKRWCALAEEPEIMRPKEPIERHMHDQAVLNALVAERVCKGEIVLPEKDVDISSGRPARFLSTRNKVKPDAPLWQDRWIRARYRIAKVVDQFLHRLNAFHLDHDPFWRMRGEKFVVIAIPLLQGGDTTTMFQVLTIVFLTNGPIEQMFNMMPRLSRAENAYYKIQNVEERLSAAQSNVLFGGGAVPDRFERIELRDVRATIREPGKPDAEPFHLGPINLAFEPGETVFICGGNGSGKTTLLSLITGLRHPDKGEILLDGHVLDDETTSGYRELFCGVFSGFHLFDRAYGMDDGELAELDRRITQLGLSERVKLREDRFSSTSLSAGQSRRLALAVALAEQRPIIVLDEFAADQDPANRAFFYDVLVPELAATGQLVLAITHDDHQFGKCDRLIKMEGGRVVSDERQTRKVAS